MTIAKCKAQKDKNSGQLVGFAWDQVADNFKCVQSINIVLGGIDEDNRYLDDIEIVSPNMKCHHEKLPPYPKKVAGMVGTFAGQGSSLVCGGATEAYQDCSKLPGDKKVCSKNVECVITAGETRWCSGPKTTDCYTFNIVTDKWELTGQLLEARQDLFLCT